MTPYAPWFAAVPLLAAFPASAADPGSSLVGGDAGPLALLGVGAALACQLFSHRRAIAERLLHPHLFALHLTGRLAVVHLHRASRHHR